MSNVIQGKFGQPKAPPPEEQVIQPELAPGIKTPAQVYLVEPYISFLIDNGYTPFLMVNANFPGTSVPQQHVQPKGFIILNVEPTAVHKWESSPEGISFHSRFNGSSFHIMLPTQSILAVFAKENDQIGIQF